MYGDMIKKYSKICRTIVDETMFQLIEYGLESFGEVGTDKFICLL